MDKSSRQPRQRLTNTDVGTWRVQTVRGVWIVDLDARVVRREQLGFLDVHTPERAWILLQLGHCTVGAHLRWVLSETPANVPVAAPRPFGIVEAIDPYSLISTDWLTDEIRAEIDASDPGPRRSFDAVDDMLEALHRPDEDD